MEVTAVILAAGEGSRLRPHTLDTPKCLLRVGSKTLLDWSIDGVRAAGVQRIVVVVGYREWQIRDHLTKSGNSGVEVVQNPDYATTNTAASALLSQPHVSQGLLLLDGDLIFEGAVLQKLFDAPGDVALLCHRTACGEEEVKVQVTAEGRITNVGKDVPVESAYGESIGVARLTPAAAGRFFEELRQLMSEGGKTLWYESAFKRMLEKGVPFVVADATGSPLIEIDTNADLLRARELVASL